MARRHDYVSFFSRRRGSRDFAGFEGPIGPSRFVIPGLAIAVLAVSVWWFAFRDADTTTGVVTLEDATIPTLLLPAGSEDEDPGLVSVGLSFDCASEVTGFPQFQGTPDRQGCVDTRVITDPEIKWIEAVGVTGWLNNPVIVNDTVYVGSAGVSQFQPDRRDGIWAFDLENGEREWFFGTELDVNGVGYGHGIIVATGDEGRVWGLGARDGSLIWTDDLGSPTFGNPLVLDEIVVVGDGAGDVVAYEIRTGSRLWQRSVTGPVRGGASSDGDIIVVAGQDADVLAIDAQGVQRWRTQVSARGPTGESARIFAAPTITDSLVIIGLVREDTFAEPALLALDKATGQLVWRSEDTAGIKQDWGNMRSSPAVVGDLLLFGEGYSNELIAVDLESGETQWAVEAGAFCYPHWPSPIINNGQAILARHDGGLYGISLESTELSWQIFLGLVGSGPASGNFPGSFQQSDFCEWGPEESFSILSSPAISPGGMIIVGTLEGYLVAIGDRSWD